MICDCPEKFSPLIISTLEQIDARWNIPSSLMSLEELVKESCLLKGHIFDLIDTGETWRVEGWIDNVLYCSPLAYPTELKPFKDLSVRIRNVF